ncbi:MAG: LLM class F420-dependent oxidoreductase [Myxococcales bacterium]|nr:LLM class F420-dependent oxidoreductase [Myxococcales bacterium]
MDLSIHIPYFTWPGAPASIRGKLIEAAEAAEELGAAHLTVMDHFFQMEAYFERPDLDMLEGYTTLGFLAGRTEKIGLGLLVTGVTYRYPAILAKIITTLDVLSGGRAQLGIGAAWYDREHKGLGIHFPGQIGRYQRLEETLQIVLQMWSDNNGPFNGKHYQLAETINVPQPIQKRPPILIGGSGEKRTLPLVAKYADACNLFGALGVEALGHKIKVLHGYLDELGRDRSEVKITVLGQGWPDPKNLAPFEETMKSYHELGVEEVYLMPVGDDPAAMIRSLTPLAQMMRSLS